MSPHTVDPYLALEITDESVFKSHSLIYQARGGGRAVQKIHERKTERDKKKVWTG